MLLFLPIMGTRNAHGIGKAIRFSIEPQTEAQKALQEEMLEKQFEIAARNGKPVNLHSRRGLRQVMERAVAYHRETGLNAQLHWFTQSRKLVRICNEEGIYVSVDRRRQSLTLAF